MTVILIWGYFLMLFYILMIIGTLLVLFNIRAFRRAELLRRNPVVDRVPYLETIRSLSRSKYADLASRGHMQTCPICLEDYSDQDEVIELSCD